MAKAEELRDSIAKLVEGLRERLEKDPDVMVEVTSPVFVPRVEVNEMSYSPKAPGVSFKCKYSVTQVSPIIRRIDRTKLMPPLDKYYKHAVEIIIDRILSTPAYRHWYKKEKVKEDVSSTLDGLLLEAAKGRGPEHLSDRLASWYDKLEHASWKIHCYLSGLMVDVKNGIKLRDDKLKVVLRQPKLMDLKELLDWNYQFEVPLPVFKLLPAKAEKEWPIKGEESGRSVETNAFSIISAVLELRGSGDYEDDHLRGLAEVDTWVLMAALALLGNCQLVNKDQYPSFFYGALALDKANIFGEDRFWMIPPQGVFNVDPETPMMLSHLLYNQCRVTKYNVRKLRKLWGYLTKYTVTAPLSTALDRYIESLQTANDPKESITHAVMAMEAIYGEESPELSFRFELYAARLLKALGEKVECLSQTVGDEEKLRKDLKNAYNIRSKFVHGDIEKIEKIDDEGLPEHVKEYARLSILALLLLGAEDGGDFKKVKKRMLDLINESLLAPERLDKLLSGQFLLRVSRLACVEKAPSLTV